MTTSKEEFHTILQVCADATHWSGRPVTLKAVSVFLHHS